MGTVKGRSNKRSSGICSSSTLIFIALSALFLWFITSNTFAPPQSTTNTPTHIITSSDQNSRKPTLNEVQPVIETHDPIKSVEKKEEDDDSNKPDANSSSSSTSEEEAGLEHNHEQQMKLENEVRKTEEADKTETKIDEDNNQGTEEEKKTTTLQGKEGAEEQEKQIALETQTSEESSVTHAQEVEQVKEEHQQDQKRAFDSQARNEEEKNGNSENEITEEDEKNRVREHQRQEDDQIKQSTDPNGATSKDQIQHDEQQPVNVNSVEDDAKTGEAKKNQEIKNQDPKSKKENKPTLSPKKTNQEKVSSSKKNEKGSTKQWSTQADQSQSQKDRGSSSSSSSSDTSSSTSSDGNGDKDSSINGYKWQLCNTTAGADYIPCLDNEKVIAKIHKRKHHEHRERHCPEDPPTCLVPLPKGYKTRIDWPQSRDKIWYHNVPHTLLAEVKGHQNWVKVVGEFLTFPGGGTQFIHGALHYIDFIQEAVPDIAWGKHSRVVLDVGCGVASLGGYLFDRDVITMSFAPKDEHEAQVQFALERGIPAISAVMGSQRLPFPSRVFDVVHCARCRVPWHADGGALLLELNRVLRPGGYFVWSATPVYQKLEEDVQIWNEMSNLTVAMCWELVTIKKDKLNSIGAAIYQKPELNDCYEQRKHNQPPMCKSDDDPNAAWYVPLQSCIHRVPVQEKERGSQWPEEWPERLQKPPYWLNASDQRGIYGKPASVDFTSDYQRWQQIVSNSYMKGLGISWSNVRNVMDMRAVYGGFAAALKEMKVWVMNVVNTDAPDTLPIIYERGLIGMYHDWCESFSTYPRSYDLLHADHLFSKIKERCKLVIVVAEVDRIVRPGGRVIVRDESSTIGEVENLLKSLHWKVFLNKVPENEEVVLSAQKSDWRPDSYAAPS